MSFTGASNVQCSKYCTVLVTNHNEDYCFVLYWKFTWPDLLLCTVLKIHLTRFTVLYCTGQTDRFFSLIIKTIVVQNALVPPNTALLFALSTTNSNNKDCPLQFWLLLIDVTPIKIYCFEFYNISAVQNKYLYCFVLCWLYILSLMLYCTALKKI